MTTADMSGTPGTGDTAAAPAVGPVPGTPTVNDVRRWLRQAANTVSPEELEFLLRSAIEAQAANHRIPADRMPTPLAEAILRRVAKAIASRELPLGMVIGDYEYQGPVTVRRWDAEIAERENRYYVHAVA